MTDAVRRFAAQHGHTDIPVLHSENELAVGKWVSAVRYRYRKNVDQVPVTLRATLDNVPGWSWGARGRGRPAYGARNAEVCEMHKHGVSVPVIAEQYKVTTQRIHQILKRCGDWQ